MEEHYEVPPCSQRVVWLNGQHMKPMIAFEALTRALGWGYNHHKPQVVWQPDCSVRLAVPKVRRVRGHTSHAHPQATPTSITTHVQMGTYLTFYLERASCVQQCCLVLEGLEAVKPREGGQEEANNKITITRLDTADLSHTLDYPKGALHDEGHPSPVDPFSRTPTTEKLSPSPTKLSNAGGKASVSHGKLSRTNNKQQSNSKASRSNRSCSKRKRNLRLTPARTTAGDDTSQDGVGGGDAVNGGMSEVGERKCDDTTTRDGVLRKGVVTLEVPCQGRENTLSTSEFPEHCGPNSAPTYTSVEKFGHHKFVGDNSPRSSDYTEGAPVSNGMTGKLDICNGTNNLLSPNEAGSQAELAAVHKESNGTYNGDVHKHVEKLNSYSNSSNLDATSRKNNMIDGKQNGCGTNTSLVTGITTDTTQSSNHILRESEHNGHSDTKRTPSRSPSKPLLRVMPSEPPLTTPNAPYKDSLGTSEGVWSVEADLSSPDEVTAILSGDDSDGNDEWEDEDDEDIYKVVRKCVSADITALLHQPLSTTPQETETNWTHLSAPQTNLENTQLNNNIPLLNVNKAELNHNKAELKLNKPELNLNEAELKFNKAELNMSKPQLTVANSELNSSNTTCSNSIINGTTHSGQGGSTEHLDNAPAANMSPVTARSASEDQLNDRHSEGEPSRNRSVSHAGVVSHTHSNGTPDGGVKEPVWRGSLDPKPLLNGGNRTSGDMVPGLKEDVVTGDEVWIQGENDRIDCERMIKSYEDKIRLSKANSNQHARASHLIEEIIENRWNETKLRRIANNKLRGHDDAQHVNKQTEHDFNHKHNAEMETSCANNNNLHPTTTTTFNAKPNAVTNPSNTAGDNTEITTQAKNSNGSKESLSSNRSHSSTVVTRDASPSATPSAAPNAAPSAAPSAALSSSSSSALPTINSTDNTSTAIPSLANNSCSWKESVSLNGGSRAVTCDLLSSTASSSCSPAVTGANTEPGQLLMLLLRPSTVQQAWQFQAAHLTVWYRDRGQRRPSGEGGVRRPPRRTRLTYRTVMRPITARGLTAAS